MRRNCEKADRSATPGCDCRYCRAVYDEWGEQAVGFQKWLATDQAKRLLGRSWTTEGDKP